MPEKETQESVIPVVHQCPALGWDCSSPSWGRRGGYHVPCRAWQCKELPLHPGRLPVDSWHGGDETASSLHSHLVSCSLQADQTDLHTYCDQRLCLTIQEVFMSSTTHTYLVAFWQPPFVLNQFCCLWGLELPCTQLQILLQGQQSMQSSLSTNNTTKQYKCAILNFTFSNGFQ